MHFAKIGIGLVAALSAKPGSVDASPVGFSPAGAPPTNVSLAAPVSKDVGLWEYCDTGSWMVENGIKGGNGNFWIYCQHWLFGKHWDKIFLDECLGNNNGRLTPAPRGNYTSDGGCYVCRKTPNNEGIMRCVCPDNKGELKDTIFDLASLLWYNNWRGDVCCLNHDTCGNWYPKPPIPEVAN